MVRLLFRSIQVAVLGMMLFLQGHPLPVLGSGTGPLTIDAPLGYLPAFGFHSASLAPGAAGSLDRFIWAAGNGTILWGQGTGTIGFQAGHPGPLTLSCTAAAGGATAIARFLVLPPPHAEIFAPPRMHVGDSMPVSMPAPFIRSYLWDPLAGDGTLPGFDPVAPWITVQATGEGRFQVTGTVEDRAQAFDSGTATVRVVQGDFANPGGVMAEWGTATAVLLPSGRVLVVGGADGHGEVLAGPEWFDPGTGRWTALVPASGTPPAARRNHTATLLADGKVLIAGGCDQGGGGLASAELYDPLGNAWNPTAGLNNGRGLHTATLLPGDGSVLVAGGYDGSDQLASAERYDPATASWTLAASLATARSSHGAALTAGGKVLVMGGEAGLAVLGSSELYDPGAGAGRGDSWIPQGPLRLPRTEHAATALEDGGILVGGGRNLTGSMDCPERFDPRTRTWGAAGGGQAGARSGHTATLLNDGTVLMAGGSGDTLATATAQRFDPIAMSWTDAGNPMASPRTHHTATLLADGTVLAAGGTDSEGTPLATADAYDPVSNLWSPAGTMADARSMHGATLLADGEVLVTGGLGSGSWGPQCSAERFDGSVWTGAKPLGTARFAHTATALADGTVLVAGGLDTDFLPLASVERYDPQGDAWLSPIEPLRTPRASHTATLLGNGKLLVVGGFSNGTALGSAEIYDPATGVWAAAACLKSPRGGHTATLLGNGKVLVTGGSDLRTQLASAELYDPAADAWADAGLLDSPRASHTATLLQDGATVAVFGGDQLQANLELWK
jgi:N-acetylneuraminic acid mutarotase